MWQEMKNNSRVKFAVGLALVVVVGAVLWNGSLRYDIDAVRGVAVDQVETADGNVKAVPVPAIDGVIGLLINLAVMVLVAIGGYAMTGLEWLAGKAKTVASEASEKLEPIRSSVEVTIERLIKELGDAVALDDSAKAASLQVQIRKPYAAQEIADSILADDFAAARAIIDKLEAMTTSGAAGTGPASKSKKGAANA